VKILSVVGARPNFMKIAAICEAVKDFNRTCRSCSIEHVLVHTGQHYDASMSDFFFSDLGLPRPDLFLGVGSGSHSQQMARIMKRFESVLLKETPDVVVVVGDVNSAVACALVAKKTSCFEAEGNSYCIPKLAHVEAGLRSFDRTMPEEVNRVVTDALADYLFTTEESANQNLIQEGISKDKIYFVGNVMIDTLLRHRAKAEKSTILSDLQLRRGDTSIKPYAVLTLHRPSNVDDRPVFQQILEALAAIGREMPVFFPVHPRTTTRIKEFGLERYFDFFSHHSTRTTEHSPLTTYHSTLGTHGSRIIALEPLSYLEFLQLMSQAKVVLTDSGGIQEETTILEVPCLTLRENTERPVTVEQGTNVIVGADRQRIIEGFQKLLRNNRKPALAPLHWDGKAARRILQILTGDYSAIGRQREREALTPAEDILA
jgi:UDP-N-acetylglucosamine 2-epimerase (non-hydrolysing)